MVAKFVGLRSSHFGLFIYYRNLVFRANLIIFLILAKNAKIVSATRPFNLVYKLGRRGGEGLLEKRRKKILGEEPLLKSLQ